ncbi:MAG: hypothetical protein ACFB51_14815 [Anaerolineae bacterium]
MMYQGDAEILFPPRVIAMLRELRGPDWQTLVDFVDQQPPDSIEKQAFTLMMIRLDGCLTCTPDSFRAMRGCKHCAQQTIIRFKGGDADLIARYEQAKQDMLAWHELGLVPEDERLPLEE